MKRILQISLLLNCALLLGLILGKPADELVPMPRTPRGEVRPLTEQSFQKNQLATPSPSETPWETIEDADPRRLIEKLRSIGCPEQTIRDIVILRVCRAYREHLIEFEFENARAWNYTRSPDHRDLLEQNETRQDLRDEMQSTLESLFGETWQSLTANIRGRADWGNDSLAQFSIEARRRIREVDKQFRRAMNEMDHKRLMGEFGSKDAAQLRELERRKQAALAAVLSPQELGEYLYRQSPAANYVLRNMPEAKSEAEFRAMVKLALDMGMSGSIDTLSSRYGQPGDSYPDQLRQEVAQRKADYDQQLKSLLGEERVDEQRAQERLRAEEVNKRRERQAEQRVLDDLIEKAAEVGVGAEAAESLFNRMKEMQPELEARFTEMEKALTGSPEEKAKHMKAAMRAEFERIAVETMGEQGRRLVEKLVESNP